MSRKVYIWSFLALLVMALSLGPSFAHLLEAAPRLTVWSPDLWRETTVFNAQFMYFAIIGGPLDVLAILLGVIVTFLVRHERPAFWLALAATIAYAASLATWTAVVVPMNSIMGGWQPGPLPANFDAVRAQWETGHIVMTVIKTVGLSCMIGYALSIGRRPAGTAEPASVAAAAER
jgi:hypothetical protein